MSREQEYQVLELPPEPDSSSLEPPPCFRTLDLTGWLQAVAEGNRFHGYAAVSARSSATHL